uniref:protein tyrosine phosphatase receptor type C-associated protein n=1 Tax=Jaculus jaculus TaxID=51337 RepID=UPI001E1B2C8C|nr:protein tyrosine phosphatase receptor type C-associated protein [Jaculus jaculus]
MAVPHALGLGVLLALPRALGSGMGTEDGAGSSSVTIVLLLLLLLLLVTSLVLAWRRLSRDSGGYYHPARLGAALWGHTRRLLWASPPGRWLQAHIDLKPPEQRDNDQDGEDDFVMVSGLQEAEPQEEEQQCQGEAHMEQVPEAHDTDSEGGLGLGSQGPMDSGGSAEALLSNLHAFSGTAAWDDSTGGAGGRGLHVTAL